MRSGSFLRQKGIVFNLLFSAKNNPATPVKTLISGNKISLLIGHSQEIISTKSEKNHKDTGFTKAYFSILNFMVSYKKTLAFLLFGLISMSALAGKVSLENMTLELSKLDIENLGIIIWDQRPMVADQSQDKSFVGYRRSYTQIAHPSFTKSERGLSEILLEKIKSAYKEVGVSVHPLASTPFDNRDQIMSKITGYEHDKVLLLKLNKLFFDGTFKLTYFVLIELQLFDSNGELLFSKNIGEEVPMGLIEKYKKTTPKTLKVIMENILNAEDVVNAINTKSTGKKKVGSSTDFDLLVTKDGDAIEADVIEINETSIRYKLHSQPDGPVRVISISRVFMIRYKNGDKEMFR